MLPHPFQTRLGYVLVLRALSNPPVVICQMVIGDAIKRLAVLSFFGEDSVLDRRVFRFFFECGYLSFSKISLSDSINFSCYK